MHQTGSQMWSSLWRNGSEILLNRVEYYQFELQRITPKNIEIFPGDRISVHCVYNRKKDNDTRFGEASTDEMCIHYLFYYPRSNDNVCGFNYRNRSYTSCNNNFLNDIPNPSVKDPVRDINQRYFGRKNINYICKNDTKTSISTRTSSTIRSSTISSLNDNIDSSDYNRSQYMIYAIFGVVIIILIAIIVILAIRNCQLKKRTNYFDDYDLKI